MFRELDKLYTTGHLWDQPKMVVMLIDIDPEDGKAWVINDGKLVKHELNDLSKQPVSSINNL